LGDSARNITQIGAAMDMSVLQIRKRSIAHHATGRVRRRAPYRRGTIEVQGRRVFPCLIPETTLGVDIRWS
jgi:hypothetical protein